MDKLPYVYVLVFCCLTLVCTDGQTQGFSSSCDVVLRVQRWMTWTAAPHERLTVRCPVKHCGNSPNVIWCKLDHADNCEPIDDTENIEIRQDDSHDKDEMTSFLTFKQISMNDSGLYRCQLRGQSVISHAINISVSDVHQGVQTFYNNKDGQVLSAPEDRHVSWRVADKPVTWQALFSLFVSIVLLLLTLALLALLSFHGFKRTLTFNHTKRQEMSAHMIPDLPGQSAPCSLVMHSHLSTLKDVCSPSTADRPPKLPVMTSRIEHQASDRAVYAVINHQRSGTTATGQHTETGRKTNAEYATIKHF